MKILNLFEHLSIKYYSKRELSKILYKNDHSDDKIQNFLNRMAPVIKERKKPILNKRGQMKLKRLLSNYTENAFRNNNSKSLSSVYSLEDLYSEIENLNDVIEHSVSESGANELNNKKISKLYNLREGQVLIFDEDTWVNIWAIITDKNHISYSKKEIQYKIDENRLFDMFIMESGLIEAKNVLDTAEFKAFLVLHSPDALLNRCSEKKKINFISEIQNCFREYKKDHQMVCFFKKYGIGVNNNKTGHKVCK